MLVDRSLNCLAALLINSRLREMQRSSSLLIGRVAMSELSSQVWQAPSSCSSPHEAERSQISSKSVSNFFLFSGHHSS